MSALVSAFAGFVQVMQLPAKGLNFAFVRVFLAFGKFQHLKHFLHVIQGFLQSADDLGDLVDRLFDARGGGWSEIFRRPRRLGRTGLRAFITALDWFGHCRRSRRLRRRLLFGMAKNLGFDLFRGGIFSRLGRGLVVKRALLVDCFG
jgi:hypothetical protein